MKKNLILTFFLALYAPFCPFTLKAATLEETIQAVQSTYEKATDVSSEFVQKVQIKSLDREVQKLGKAIFKKPGKLKVEYTAEDGRIYTSNGKKLWVYEKGDTQANAYKVSPKTMPEEALAFLGGLGKLNAQFKVSAVTPALKKKYDVHEGLDWLVLKPKNPASQLDQLILGFDKNSHLIKEAFMKNETGNQSHYVFRNVDLNTGIADSTFEFSPPKGVKVIENK